MGFDAMNGALKLYRAIREGGGSMCVREAAVTASCVRTACAGRSLVVLPGAAGDGQ